MAIALDTPTIKLLNCNWTA